MPPYTDHRIPTNGINLQVREYPFSGPCLLLLHFGGANLMMWQPVVPAFNERFHLVLVDLRDHGHSDKPLAGDDMDTMAQDVVGVLDALRIDQVHVLGSSLGAEVGLSLAVLHPQRVKSLVCDGALYSEFGPYGKWEGSEAEFRKYTQDLLEKYHSRDDLFPSAEAFQAARKAALEKYDLWNPAIAAMWAYDACRHEDGQYSRSNQWQARRTYSLGYFNSHFEDYYPKVQCPVLMVTGDDPEISPRERAATLAMSKLAPHSRLVVVPGWDHPYGWLKTPTAMSATVMDFIQALD